MSVYVDNVRLPFGRMVMCHLWADSLAELYAMVDAIGVQRKWLQQPPKASWVHFDIALGKKAQAILRGAILTDKYGPVEHTAKLDIASGEPDRITRGRRKLAQIENIRALVGPTRLCTGASTVSAEVDAVSHDADSLMHHHPSPSDSAT